MPGYAQSNENLYREAARNEHFRDKHYASKASERLSGIRQHCGKQRSIS